MKRLANFLLVMLLPFITTMVMAEGFREGAQYLKLQNPQQTASTDKVEVVELFWYGCPHCYKLEPYIKEWAANKPDDVEFIRMPAILGPGWELLAKAWYSAELLGVTDKIHPALFEELHERKNRINNVNQLRAFFANHGVSNADFDKTFKSFAVAVKLNNARLMTRRYALTGVPTLIVNGKFSTSASLAGGNTNIIKVVDYLIGQERKHLVAPVEATEPAVSAVSQ